MLKWIPLAFLLMMGPAMAGHQGGAVLDRDGIMQGLEKDYKEKVVARGLASNGSMLEVTASPDGTTWSIVMTNPMTNGAQIAVVGQAWETLNPFGE